MRIAARARWARDVEAKTRIAWLGGIPLASGKELVWSHHGLLKRLSLDSAKAAERLAEALEEARPRPGSLYAPRDAFKEMAGFALTGNALKRLTKAGLQLF